MIVVVCIVESQSVWGTDMQEALKECSKHIRIPRLGSIVFTPLEWKKFCIEVSNIVERDGLLSPNRALYLQDSLTNDQQIEFNSLVQMSK